MYLDFDVLEQAAIPVRSINLYYCLASQAIGAFEKAREIDPTNLEALLSLGVSYANELEEVEVVNSMMTWLKQHPDHQEAARATPPPPGNIR